MGDPLAAHGEIPWPSAGRFVSAYGEVLMAADTSSSAASGGVPDYPPATERR